MKKVLTLVLALAMLIALAVCPVSAVNNYTSTFIP